MLGHFHYLLLPFDVAESAWLCGGGAGLGLLGSAIAVASEARR